MLPFVRKLGKNSGSPLLLLLLLLLFTQTFSISLTGNLHISQIVCGIRIVNRRINFTLPHKVKRGVYYYDYY
jgi:hypothetical protein